MNKMQMAHDMALELVKIKPSLSAWQIADRCFEYADAMQAEADKREKIELSNKSIETVLNSDLSQPMCLEDVSEWQPDWSQAPDGYNYWVATADHSGKISGGWFYDVKPKIGKSDGVSIYYSSNSNAVSTESFGYTGSWQNSLRKRPQ